EKAETKKEAQLTSGQAMLPAEPPFEERTETNVVYYKPAEDEYIPKRLFTRWLYYRSQIILGALTLGILVFYLIQWLEFRSAKQLENRAWVAVKSVQTVRQGPDFGTVFLTLVNSGRTPGTDGEIRAKLELLDNAPLETTEVPPATEATSKILFSPQV